MIFVAGVSWLRGSDPSGSQPCRYIILRLCHSIHPGVVLET